LASTGPAGVSARSAEAARRRSRTAAATLAPFPVLRDLWVA